MNPRAVVVAHRQTMVAQGIAAALAGFPGVVPVAVAGTAEEAERRGARANAVAIDELIPGAEAAAGRLRKKGVRVVLLGEGGAASESLRVSTGAPVSSLASALAPGATSTDSSYARLTPREREILSLVARGFAGKEVARQLGISPKTVEQHKTRIFSKLGVPNATAAVSRALTEGLGEQPWSLASI